MTSESSAGVQGEVRAGRSGVEEVLIGPLQGVHRCWSGSFEKLSVHIRHEDQCAQTGVDRSRCPQVSSVSCGKSFSNTMTTTLLRLMSRKSRQIRCFTSRRTSRGLRFVVDLDLNHASLRTHGHADQRAHDDLGST